jgi:hypothetical protein
MPRTFETPRELAQTRRIATVQQERQRGSTTATTKGEKRKSHAMEPKQGQRGSTTAVSKGKRRSNHAMELRLRQLIAA